MRKSRWFARTAAIHHLAPPKAIDLFAKEYNIARDYHKSAGCFFVLHNPAPYSDSTMLPLKAASKMHFL
jgi:hypothetical protein